MLPWSYYFFGSSTVVSVRSEFYTSPSQSGVIVSVSLVLDYFNILFSKLS